MNGIEIYEGCIGVSWALQHFIIMYYLICHNNNLIPHFQNLYVYSNGGGAIDEKIPDNLEIYDQNI